MRPGANGELILEGETETRLVAHMFITHKTEDFLSHIEPPVELYRVSRLEFIVRRFQEGTGTADPTEHKIKNPRMALIVGQLISLYCVPDNVLTASTSTWTRRGFLADRVRTYWQLAAAEDTET